MNERRAKTRGTSRERQRWMVAQLLEQEAEMDQIKVKQEDAHVDKVGTQNDCFWTTGTKLEKNIRL